MSPDELQRLNEQTVANNNALINQENKSIFGRRNPQQQQMTPLDAWVNKRGAEMEAQKDTPIYQKEQERLRGIENSKALGNLMLANTKNGNVNPGIFQQQALSQGIDPVEAFKGMLQSKELQTKGTLPTADAQLKADTDLKVAELKNAFDSKKDQREEYKDIRETAKQTSEQYSPADATFINAQRRANADDPKAAGIFEDSLASVASDNAWSWGDLGKDISVGASGTALAGAAIGGIPTAGIGALPGYGIGGVVGGIGGLGYNIFKDRRPSARQINAEMLRRQLK